MPSELVDGVRALIRARVDAGKPVTDLERTLILATLARRVRADKDVVDELEAAIATARIVLLGRPIAAPEHPLDERRAAIRRLLAASRAVLDYDPFVEYDPAATAPAVDHGGRKRRADIDD